MHVLVFSRREATARHWQYRIEDLGPVWRCTPATSPETLLALAGGAEAALFPEGDGEALGMLIREPPLAPPYLLGPGAPDGPVPEVEELAVRLQGWRKEGRLPSLAYRRLPAATQLASALLRTLGTPQRLRAWDFLPEMIALTVVHPPLLRDLAHGLYPLIAARHGMTASGVERSLRLCVESTWSHGSFAALERFFGASVDPEKGKPTNREFLCRVQERVSLSMQRLI